VNSSEPTRRKFAPSNRLSALLAQPGGVTVRNALRDAETAVQRFRPEVMADIEARITRLEALAAAPAPDGAAIYKAAAGIIEHAGLFGMGQLGEAAYSLCELVDRLEQRSVWDADSVAVHVNGLRLLQRMPEGAAKQRLQLLEGLHAVTAKAAPARRTVRAD
jgi:hypothetical protein